MKAMIKIPMNGKCKNAKKLSEMLGLTLCGLAKVSRENNEVQEVINEYQKIMPSLISQNEKTREVIIDVQQLMEQVVSKEKQLEARENLLNIRMEDFEYYKECNIEKIKDMRAELETEQMKGVK